MNKMFDRIGAILALVIGAMAFFAGGQVLLGKDPGYYVIDWLPVYNFSMGVITIFVTTLLIWKRNASAKTAAILTFSLHAVVMLILQMAYREVVAPDSIRAMTIRLATWLVILVLLYLQPRKDRAAAA